MRCAEPTVAGLLITKPFQVRVLKKTLLEISTGTPAHVFKVLLSLFNCLHLGTPFFGWDEAINIIAL